MLKAFYRVAVLVLMVLITLLTSPTISNTYTELKASNEQALNFVGEKSSPTLMVSVIKTEKDNRAEKLENYLISKGSPMAADAQSLVKIADKYGLDWKFLPAIAGVESTYGQAVPGNSYNPYGWNNGKANFATWAVASDYVAGQIVTRWGAGDQISAWKIGPSYAACPTWAVRVTSNMKQIADYK